jgi:2'-5' RNA ligase
VSDRPERLRLFVAVDVPKAVLEELEATIAPRRADVSAARWAPLENQHVTLKFLGNVDAELFDDVVQACRDAAAATESADVRVDGLGAFPNARRARVLWAGLQDEKETLSGLAGSLDGALAPLGFEPEKRAFTPHLTLARLRVPGDVTSITNGLTFRSDLVPVREFHLYRSRLSPKGARYEVLESFALTS